MKRREFMIGFLVIMFWVLCSQGQPIEPPFIRISNTASVVCQWPTIEGDSSSTANSGLKAWVLISPTQANVWVVQQTQTYPDGTWDSFPEFGGSPGNTFSVLAILTRLNLHQGQIIRDLRVLQILESAEINISTRQC
jgi:hypothetical protein